MELTGNMLSAIEENLMQQVQRCASQPELDGLRFMIAYHMGWEGQGAGPEARGKRIRPLLVTLCAAACGGKWLTSLPSASAVELVHNFSLLHDDIEDNSQLRRGRPTVWKLWGVPQAINTGDAMFALAHLAILDLRNNLPTDTLQQSCRILQQTCLSLTQGQYLDISFEQRSEVTVEAYWQMITGKTAALISCCCELGAMAGDASDNVVALYAQFGRNLGLAFQALDDILGIWGNVSLTGKSADSDLATGKKTLPILFSLSLRSEFSQRWPSGKVPIEDVSTATMVLNSEGAMDFTKQHADRLTDQALSALAQAEPRGLAGRELESLAKLLLKRKN